ncbi:MAG: glycosyltransferase [Jaaginema sp. PMC 1079.18]|nr:glycosyltransferase [Jaaginema sp. PMC 1080.18]MEC4850916.1 glycosyltransferase [Jaaginema sp. PMC 1079.18]MEC4865555.1 glycosyltransferase [Jaaginema sp. PMC 1078.18]
MPLVSVIIPVYNGEKTIQTTVESALSQTLTDLEVIVVNSGSTDRTQQILQGMSDARLTIVDYPKAIVSVNRNRGVTQAQSDYLCFLDADDLWTKDKLACQYQALQENSQAAVVYSWTNCIDQSDRVLRKCRYVNYAGNVLPQLLLDDFIGNGSNAMIRRQAFAEVQGFDESLTNAEDTDLWLRLAAKYEFTVVPKVQVLYRISAQSKSSNVKRMEVMNLRVIEKAFSDAPSSLQYLKRYSSGNLYKYLSYRALETQPGQQKTLTTLRFILQSAIASPDLLKKPIIAKALLKLAIMTFVPSKQAELLLQQFPKIANTFTFMGYEIVDLSQLRGTDK